MYLKMHLIHPYTESLFLEKKQKKCLKERQQINWVVHARMRQGKEICIDNYIAISCSDLQKYKSCVGFELQVLFSYILHLIFCSYRYLPKSYITSKFINQLIVFPAASTEWYINHNFTESIYDQFNGTHLVRNYFRF